MNPQPTVTGWLVRDTALALIVTGLILVLGQWHAQSGGVMSATVGGLFGFVGIYALCYVVHEWGHYLGGRLSGASVPLRGYRNALMSHFDISRHSARQFLWLSWGGVAGYLLVGITGVALFLLLRPHAALAGAAIGGLAFMVQSLAVDLPQIVRVHNGAPALAVNAEGASLAVIKRRTLQTWSLLALAVVWWNL